MLAQVVGDREVAALDLDPHRDLPCSLRPLRCGIGPVRIVTASQRSRIGHRADALGPCGPQRAGARVAASRRWCGRRRRAAPRARRRGAHRRDPNAPGAAAVAGARRRPAAAPARRGAGRPSTRQPGARGERRGEQRRRVEPARRRGPGARGRHRRRSPSRSQQAAPAAGGGQVRRHQPRPRASAPPNFSALHEVARRAGVGHRRPRAVEGQARAGQARARQRQGAARAARRRAATAARAGRRRTAPRPPRPAARGTRRRPAGRRRRRARRGGGAWASHAARRRATGHARDRDNRPCFARRLATSWTFAPGADPRPGGGRHRLRRGAGASAADDGPRGAGAWRLVSFLAGLALILVALVSPVDALGDQLLLHAHGPAHPAARPRADPLHPRPDQASSCARSRAASTASSARSGPRPPRVRDRRSTSARCGSGTSRRSTTPPCATRASTSLEHLTFAARRAAVLVAPALPDPHPPPARPAWGRSLYMVATKLLVGALGHRAHVRAQPALHLATATSA